MHNRHRKSGRWGRFCVIFAWCLPWGKLFLVQTVQNAKPSRRHCVRKARQGDSDKVLDGFDEELIHQAHIDVLHIVIVFQTSQKSLHFFLRLGRQAAHAHGVLGLVAQLGRQHLDALGG